jgi:hypothetical protein
MRRKGMRRIAMLVMSITAARAEAAGFVPGEGLTFALTVGPIEAGRARMSVGAPVRKGGRTLASMQGEAHSAAWLRLLVRLDDEYKVVFDTDALLPTRVMSVETGLRERRIVNKIDGAKMAIDFAAPGETYTAARKLPGMVRDPMTALFALRAARLADGDVVPLLVLDGPALYRSTARVAGRERILAVGEEVQAIRIEIVAVRIDYAGTPVPNWWERRITAWLSDDERRIPYRISGDTDLGRASVELTSYQ